MRLRRGTSALALTAGLLLGGLTGPAVAHADEPAPLRIMPLGDSLTRGVGSTDDNGYRGRLQTALAAAGLAADFVGSQRHGSAADPDHEGHPGWRIDELDAGVPGWVLAAAPDVVLLDAGTNDYAQRYDAAHAPARLARMVDRILVAAPHARVVVAKLLVIAGDQRAAGVRALNAAVPRIAAAHPGRVVIADMSRIPVVNTVDGVHPSDLGYRQMAYQWFQALRRVTPGGAAWTAPADPFPKPAVRVTRTGRDVTVRLTGRLVPADLAHRTVRLRYRGAGGVWAGLGVARTDAHGVARFHHRAVRPGHYQAVLLP